jgi:hypothetical protein
MLKQVVASYSVTPGWSAGSASIRSLLTNQLAADRRFVTRDTLLSRMAITIPSAAREAADLRRALVGVAGAVR